MEQPAETFLQERKELLEMARSYRQSQILFTCLELGIFDLLAGRWLPAGQVAAASGADERAVELLLNAAAALGWLEKRAEGFSNAPLMERHFTPGAPGLGRRLQLESAFYHRWGNLTQAVRSGKRPPEDRRTTQAEDWVKTFIHALYDAAAPVAPVIAAALALPEKCPLRVLDVGGGHGGYSIALAQRHPLLTATVFELPQVVPVAREIIAKSGMADRVFVQEGNFQQEDLGSGYDVVLVFGVLNGEPPAGRPVLIRKVFNALNPGGIIVLRDAVLEPDRAGPPEAAIFALQMLLATDSGGLDSRADWDAWLRSAGFSPARPLVLPECIGADLVIATRPPG